MTDQTRGGAGPADKPEAFDDILGHLRKLVDRLESGNLSLEDSLLCFEEGMQLCRKGAVILDGAERRVEVLLARPGGATETAPFAAAESQESEESEDPE